MEEYGSPVRSCSLPTGRAAWGLKTGVCCGVRVRIDEQVMLPAQPALVACCLQSSATYIWDF